MNYAEFVLILICSLLPIFLSLKRSVHLFQLESYQFAGYRRALKRYNADLLSAKTVFPMAVFVLGAGFFPVLCILAFTLYRLINPPKQMKKPLVFTARVKRLFALSAVLTLAFCAAFALFCNGAFGLMLALCVVFMPWLLFVFGTVCAPVEKAFAKKFIRRAQKTLREHKNLITVGITGSYGKTSTKYFLQQLLSIKFNVYMTPGNFNTTLGVTRAVNEGLSAVHEIFLCEMGARHLGDIEDICRLAQPQIGIITSVGEQHLDTFGGIDNVLKGKLELYDSVTSRGGKMFINTDSPKLYEAVPKMTGYVTLCGREGYYKPSDIEVTSRGLRFTVTSPSGESQVFESKLLGEANVQNLTLAISCAHSLGISFKAMVPAVRSLQAVPHRLELKTAGGLSLIDDAYNSNPAGARIALDTLALFGGTRVLVTPGLVELGDREQAENEALGEYAAEKCDLALLVGEHGLLVRNGLLKAGFSEDKAISVKTVQEAFDHLRAIREENKLALILNDLPDNYR